MKMLGIRSKLSLGFGGLLVIVLVVGIQSIALLGELGGSIDVILKENYRSVVACENMKEALERMDSAALFILLGYEKEGASEIAGNERRFKEALTVELNNITLPGEREKASAIEALLANYTEVLGRLRDAAMAVDDRRKIYFDSLLPLFHQIKDTADDILRMNQENMSEANDRARRKASEARREMTLLLVTGVIVAAAFILFTGRWILRPIARLTMSANEIRKGNLDLVVRSDSNDEIGQLAQAFNAMAESLRDFRRSALARLFRTQKSIHQAFKHLPEAVAVVSLDGKIEVASRSATEAFDLKPGAAVEDLPVERLASLFREAVRTGRETRPKDGGTLIQRFVRGEERYFRPQAVPILDADKQATGVILILFDATQERQQQELKKGVIATVSHQLKTPLTSIRMAIHLLLDEKIGYLSEKQAELLVAAREEGERLNAIVENLLQINRLESGKMEMDRGPVSCHELVFQSVEPFRSAAQDRGISLSTDVPDDLPEVMADKVLINHVFANLLSNALKYTDPGGQIIVSARAENDFVNFSVADTGRGIPAQYLRKIMEQFFRVPGQTADSGAGLGLSIVQEIVEAHGGSVNVDSEEGVGSTFSFSLKKVDIGSREVSEHD
jgi:two-component system, NtrC family, sensor histidine kinase KinB